MELVTACDGPLPRSTVPKGSPAAMHVASLSMPDTFSCDIPEHAESRATPKLDKDIVLLLPPTPGLCSRGTTGCCGCWESCAPATKCWVCIGIAGAECCAVGPKAGSAAMPLDDIGIA
jgi:hypothetical protein